MSYINEFGSFVTFGIGEGVETANRSDSPYADPTHCIVVDIDYDKYGLPRANAGTGFGRGISKIPAGAIIEEVEFFVTKEGATKTATLNIGVSEKDGTVIDADGLAAGIATSAGVAFGEGALVNGQLAEAGYITAAIATGTASDLAGLKGKIVVRFL